MPSNKNTLKQYLFRLCTFLLLGISSTASAQTFVLSGKVFEKTSMQPVIGASVAVKKQAKLVAGSSTNEKGLFTLTNLLPDTYDLSVSYIGLKTKNIRVVVSADKYLGGIFLENSDQKLNEVTVEGTQIRVEQKGDTTSINAGAYKVNPDATAEDLVKKMPGITVENGTVKAQGEDVKKVLVDGKEFFGDDAQMALKNLPAEVVDKVQIFNRMGDQAQFTGFNDGNTDKTMNITTKSGRNNGKFGKVYAGYGTDNRYQAGTNMNIFNGERRITVLGMSNNINQQNFSMQDLFGGSGNMPRMPMGGGGGGGRSYGGGGGGSDMSNFFVGQQNGISLTNSIGINYADKWGKKTQISGSYFFNSSSTNTDKQTLRTYIINAENTQLNNDSTGSLTDNFNNRFNLRLEHTFDSFNSIIYTPKFSFQKTATLSDQLAANSVADTTLNETKTHKDILNNGYSIGNNVLFRHKFVKPGRTISLNLSHDLNNKVGETVQYSDVYSLLKGKSTLNQNTNSTTKSNVYNANLTYTENLTKVTQLQLSYNPTLNKNIADKSTNRFDSTTSEYSAVDSILSNIFDNTITTHRGNVSLNINKDKYSLTVGVTQQYLTIASLQSFPANNQFEKSYSNTLPNIVYQYKFTNSKTLRIVYRTNTNNPNVNQLQNVIDNSNPISLSAGNPNLKQEYSHTFLTRYGINNWHNSQTFFVFAMASFTNDYIANTTYTSTRDSILPNGILFARGAQLMQAQNLDGYISARSFATYGIPMKKFKSNLNLNLGVNYSKIPGKTNNQINYANTINLTGGLVLGSNISERVDFTVSHNANINLVKNSLLTTQSSDYFINTSNVKVNLMPTKSWVLSSDVNYTNYQGLGSAFNQDFLLWNAGVAYKFMKKMAEVKLSVFDLLDQNNSIGRTVTETYIEDTRSNVLNRYFMLTFTYNIRKFTPVAPK